MSISNDVSDDIIFARYDAHKTAPPPWYDEEPEPPECKAIRCHNQLTEEEEKEGDVCEACLAVIKAEEEDDE